MCFRIALVLTLISCAAWASDPAVTIPNAALAPRPSVSPSVPRAVVSPNKLVRAAAQSATDDIGSGWCGRGVFSILNSMGLGNGLKGGNGQDWEKILREAGWKPLRCLAPQQAPYGSVLVYLGDARSGKIARGTRGGYFGHVEIVALDRGGRRLYVSDSPRANPGGTVRDNFTGRAWLPPGSSLTLPKPPPVEMQVAEIFKQRQQMAQDYFSGKRPQFVQLDLK